MSAQTPNKLLKSTVITQNQETKLHRIQDRKGISQTPSALTMIPLQSDFKL